VFSRIAMFFQDFAAPFHIFLKARYKMSYVSFDDDFYASSAQLKTTISTGAEQPMVFEVTLDKKGIASFDFKQNSNSFKAVCTE
jgi:hypothetical protein